MWVEEFKYPQIDLQKDTFEIIPNYIPPPYYYPTYPLARPNLYLYGGEYPSDTFYACDTIFAGGVGAPPMPYFSVASSANVVLIAGDEVNLVDGFDAADSANVHIFIDSTIQCCPSFSPELIYNRGTKEKPAEINHPGAPAANKKVGKEEMAPSSLGVKLYPNPFNDFLDFKFGSEESPQVIRVTALSGRTITTVESPKSTEVRINSSDWPVGVYLVELVWENKIERRNAVKVNR